MKRKVIQLAGKTQVVSLPSKWVQKYNVRKGDEIELEERGRDILLKTQSEPESRRIEFDTRGKNSKILAWTMSALYKTGYDEIEFIYDSPQTIAQIQQALKDYFVGFVIINQTKGRCTIKSISKDSEEEFEATLRRAFLVTITLGENLSEALRSADMESIKSLLSLEKTNNQLTAFCERLLNRVGHKNAPKTIFYYVLAWNLEKVCDDYKYICGHIIDNLDRPSQAKEIIHYLDEANRFLKDFYELFYKFEPDRLLKLSENAKSLSEKGEALLESSRGKNSRLISLLLDMVSKIADFVPSTISIKN